MGKFFKAATLGLPLCAMLGLAQPAYAADAPAPSTARPAPAATRAATSKPAKFCARHAVSANSRIVTQSCRTRQEWEARGYELISGK